MYACTVCLKVHVPHGAKHSAFLRPEIDGRKILSTSQSAAVELNIACADCVHENYRTTRPKLWQTSRSSIANVLDAAKNWAHLEDLCRKTSQLTHLPPAHILLPHQQTSDKMVNRQTEKHTYIDSHHLKSLYD